LDRLFAAFSFVNSPEGQEELKEGGGCTLFGCSLCAPWIAGKSNEELCLGDSLLSLKHNISETLQNIKTCLGQGF